MKHLYTFFFFIVITNSFFGQKNNRLKNGMWRAELSLDPSHQLPFQLKINAHKGQTYLTVINGDERIDLKQLDSYNDTVVYTFPMYHSELHFSINSSKEINGFWRNYDKKDYKIAFNAKYSKAPRFKDTISSKTLTNYTGKWKTSFKEDVSVYYPAIGVFKQNKNHLVGTFLTETGDYRFLEGNVYGDHLYLSCFDGSHAFLFNGELKKDTLSGEFLSGKHWKTTWTATQNDDFELSHPDSLTYVKEDQPHLELNLKDLNHNYYSYPNQETKGKVVIIQILGTWCPNCMDETRYYKELYAKYHDQGLEIISVCYETGEDEETYFKRVQSYKEKLDLDFTFLIGGKANKGKASEHFSVLNQIISFPTSIFIDRNGDIQRIHTGFNGPSTGSYYTDYTTKTDKLIEELIKK